MRLITLILKEINKFEFSFQIAFVLEIILPLQNIEVARSTSYSN